MPHSSHSSSRTQALQQALALHKSGKLDAAAAAYAALLEQDGQDFDANHYLGMVRVQQGRAGDAIPLLNTATAINPQSALAWSNLGVALMGAQQPQAAADAYARAATLRPDNVDTHIKHAQALYAVQSYAPAVEALERALALRPDDADITLTLGRARLEVAHQLRRDKKLRAAIDAYAAAASADPQNPDIYFYWGLLLYDLGQYDGAVAAYTKLLSLPGGDNGAVYQARAEALRRLERAEDALADYDRAAELLPHDHALALTRLHAHMKICDWRLYDTTAALMARVRADHKAVVLPFPLVALPVSAADQRLCADRYVAARLTTQAEPWQHQDYGHQRIRIAYVSADFHRHATLFLMAGMFEAHDKSRYEIIAVSLGRDDKSTLRARVVAAVDDFIDAQHMSDEEVAALLRARQCDIVVDLKGFTMDARAGIFTGRHAPVQVAYIGYPGTCALPNIDYFIGDHVAVTPDIAATFSEKVVYLPNSYQVNDDKRQIAAQRPTRSDLGLPEDAFVYCSFNNSYKFTPDVFACWMDILARVDNSVLWLLADSDLSMHNLRHAAGQHGIDPARLIFAPKVDAEAHLARLACADLFLDNLPCNAHTTASDALWAGLPVLTCAGDTFAGRVAASLLTAAGLPELVTRDLPAYTELAVDLARDTVRYRALRQKLADDRGAMALFDTARTTRNIERAYDAMMERFRKGLPPDHIVVRED